MYPLGDKVAGTGPESGNLLPLPPERVYQRRTRAQEKRGNGKPMALLDPLYICQPIEDILADQNCNAQVLLNSVNDAILALTKGNLQKYALDTGANRVEVSRLNLEELYKMRENLIVQIQTLSAAAGNASATHMRPLY